MQNIPLPRPTQDGVMRVAQYQRTSINATEPIALTPTKRNDMNALGLLLLAGQLAMSTTAEASEERDGKIVNGTIAKLGEFPYAVSPAVIRLHSCIC